MTDTEVDIAEVNRLVSRGIDLSTKLINSFRDNGWRADDQVISNLGAVPPKVLISAVLLLAELVTAFFTEEQTQIWATVRLGELLKEQPNSENTETNTEERLK